MAKGSIAKEAITQKILGTFEGSFVYGKEIRIPYDEDGNRVEIKVTLTCAKENVGGDSAFTVTEGQSTQPAQASVPAAPTEEEKANITNLMQRLGL
jgi:hypothetical protein